jgi:hypothetical protein
LQDGDFVAKRIYRNAASHRFLTCRVCNTVYYSIAFFSLAVSLVLAVFWIYTFFYAPINKIPFLIPKSMLDMKFTLWTFVFGLFYLLFSVCGILVIDGIILSGGFAWRSRKLEKLLPLGHGIGKISQFEYERLKTYMGGS